MVEEKDGYVYGYKVSEVKYFEIKLNSIKFKLGFDGKNEV